MGLVSALMRSINYLKTSRKHQNTASIDSVYRLNHKLDHLCLWSKFWLVVDFLYWHNQPSIVIEKLNLISRISAFNFPSNSRLGLKNLALQKHILYEILKKTAKSLAWTVNALLIINYLKANVSLSPSIIVIITQVTTFICNVHKELLY